MKRNPLPGFVLGPVCLIICLLVGSSVGSVSVMGQTGASLPATEGSFVVLDADGKLAGACPLKHTDVKTEISGFLARVVVTQEFENPFTDKIEAVYTFPLPQAAAVDDMTIIVGNRIVKGQIMRREEAQATYDAARARGQVAAILNQERPNIFTQAVANILPGQKIKVTISYVETLKYTDGSYEWSFPMVVAQRYTPAPANGASAANQTTTEPANADDKPTESEASKPETTADQTPETESAETETPSSETADRVPDAEPVSAPAIPPGMRFGHDVSIEVNIDAGVPLVSFQSKTHEIDALQPGAGKATVRLRDQATIPNKDFVLKYDVAGSQIEDALLSHHNDKGGYFTFILQPPQRVTAADTMPKELVFVLDTSGSMSGFPIDKARETMILALDGLYSQDTFNVITFAGDTQILFPQPVAATPENLSTAKKFLTLTQSGGGTEMMKAIRAALAPSDAQNHVRITCFMTDGVVGNDAEIIAEVQKHKNARVFAMGFGSAPNRFLLDKITEHGRGEVEYVAAQGETAGVAKRFHERIRNPLLTDVSIDWGGLAVTDVYPKSLPDLFSAQPVIVSGRYAGAGKGTIRLRGTTTGGEFVREIPVELPEQENAHDVLATLWARRKVDDLMGQDMNGVQSGKMEESLKTQIVDLGLAYRMMTQFTSFVAVEEGSPVDGVEPRRVEVPMANVNLPYQFSGGAYSTVMVMSSPSIDTASYVTATITESPTQSLPIQGRSVQGFILLTPGTSHSGPATPASFAPINISMNGQRPTSNGFILDGVDGDFGMAPGGQSPGAAASGSAPPLTATGDTSTLASVNAVQEATISSYSFAPEHGRSSGGQISIVSKAGTNEFHGDAFYLFNHEALDANDWFANSLGLAKPRHRLSEFGGAFGGPIKRDHWFFFGSYEGSRLRQPVVALTDVPSLASRSAAPANVQPLLNLYPLPNGPERLDGFAQFASSFANAGRHDVGSLRLDGMPLPTLTLSAYVNFADSTADERGASGLSLNTLDHLASRAQRVTGSAIHTASSTTVLEVRANYSRFTARSAYALDTFGGATLPSPLVFNQLSNSTQLSADLNARSTQLMSGSDATSTQRQFNLLGAVLKVSGNHSMKFGTDYRRLSPIIGLRGLEQSALFDGVTQALTGNAARINFFTRSQSVRPAFNQFSAFAQDEWRATAKFTLNYGLRWEVSGPPSSSNQDSALAVDQVDDVAQIAAAPAGTPLWKTTYGNFAPRVGLAYSPYSNDDLVFRGSLGIRYDLANAAVGDAFADSYPFLNGQSQFNVPFAVGAFAAPAPANPTVVTVPFSAFDPHLQVPYLIEWSASVQREIGYDQSIGVSYVGNAGRRLLLTNTLLNQNSNFEFLRLTDNGTSSTYHALQLQFNRRFRQGLGAMVSYTWSKSIDDASQDSAARALFRNVDARLERGPSDFDIRHTLAGYVSYDVPALFASGVGNSLTRNWSLDSVFNVRSAAPVNVVYAVPTTFGFLYVRPDLISGASLYLADVDAAGGRRINPAAFSAPTDIRQGTLGRNALRGFALSQVNLALRRRFSFTDAVKLTLGAEAANIFNHPNFAAPGGNDASLGTRFAPATALSSNPTFGQSYTNAASSPWGIAGSSFGASYYPGGARAFKLTAKLQF